MSEEEILKGLKASLSQGSLGPLEWASRDSQKGGVILSLCQPCLAESLVPFPLQALTYSGLGSIWIQWKPRETLALLVSGAWKFIAGFPASP